MAIASILFDPTAGSDAESKADSNALAVSTADSKAVIADSKALSAAVEASTADSKAVVADDEACTADSKAASAAVEASTADSKAVVADGVADTASTNVASAIGSEPEVGEYRLTDMHRDNAGKIVMEYDDSAIT